MSVIHSSSSYFSVQTTKKCMEHITALEPLEKKCTKALERHTILLKIRLQFLVYSPSSQ